MCHSTPASLSPLLSETIQENGKNHCGFVVSCLVSTVSHHVPSKQKEHINNHKVHEFDAEDRVGLSLGRSAVSMFVSFPTHPQPSGMTAGAQWAK